MMKEIPSNTLVYGSASAISAMENLQRKLETMIRKFVSLGYSFPSTLLQRRVRCGEHWARIHFPMGSQNESGRQHPLNRLGQAMKRGTPKKRREQRSALRDMTMITREHHHSRVFQTN
jgi:hypothetical protein